MTSMTDFVIELHAVDLARNRRRAWRVVAGVDLFGRWTTDVTFGRIGSAGRTICHAFASEAEALSFVRSGLRRRASAARRIGVAYRRISVSPEAAELVISSGIR